MSSDCKLITDNLNINKYNIAYYKNRIRTYNQSMIKLQCYRRNYELMSIKKQETGNYIYELAYFSKDRFNIDRKNTYLIAS